MSSPSDVDFYVLLTDVIDRSVTLVGEADRKMLKAAIKHSSGGEDQIRHRQAPPEVVSKWSQKLDSLKQEISEILVEEKEEKQVSSPAFYLSVIAVHKGGAIDSFAKPRWS